MNIKGLLLPKKQKQTSNQKKQNNKQNRQKIPIRRAHQCIFTMRITTYCNHQKRFNIRTNLIAVIINKGLHDILQRIYFKLPEHFIAEVVAKASANLLTLNTVQSYYFIANYILL